MFDRVLVAIPNYNTIIRTFCILKKMAISAQMETASPYTTKKNLSDNMKHFFYKGLGAISAKIGSTSDVD
jgi:hypothetical protein